MKFRILGQLQALTSEQKKELKSSYKLNLTRSDADKEFLEEANPEDLVELTLTDDTIWYLEAGELHRLFLGQPLRSNEADSAEITVSAEVELPLRDGRGKAKLFIKVLCFLLRADTSRESTIELAKEFEDHKTKGKMGLYGVGQSEDGFKVLNKTAFEWEAINGRKKPVLLMVHGTAASTKASYSDLLFRKERKDKLVPSEHWEKIWAEYGNGERIIAFEHRSLTESPIQNLVLLVEQLNSLLPKVTEFHIISQSRGGQIVELLIGCLQVPGFIAMGYNMLSKMGHQEEAERLKTVGKLLKNKNINVTKFIRVCCPTAGTNFLGERLEVGLSILFNLAKDRKWYLALAPDILRQIVVAVARHRDDPTVLPGLYAQKPSTYIVKLLNAALYQVTTTSDGKETASDLALDHKLFVVQGNAVVRGDQDERDFRVIIYESLQEVFRAENDFVVDTDSMTMGLPRPGKGFYLHIENTTIHHLSYYEDGNVQRAIAEALFAKPEQDNFASYKTIDYSAGARNRGDLVNLPDGSLSDKEVPKGEKPIVVLLPGIMGSNLSHNGEEIWVDYPRIFLGDLDKLEINEPGITAGSVVKDAYGSLYVYLKKKGYDVVVFPYDWRKSITEASKLLNTKLEALRLAFQQPIHLIAHSMGGLVVRGMICRDDSTWTKLKHHFGGSRCILLGTPWMGSYLIPQTLTGFGRTINSLSMLDIKHTKAELLQQFVEYPGLLELLPAGGNPEHAFFKDEKDTSIWDAFVKSNKSNTWTKPAAAKLKTAEEQAKLAEKDLDFTNVFYIAGQSSRTVSNAMLQNRYGHKIPFNSQTIKDVPKDHKLVFTATKRGDGSVTWDTGIPKKLKENHRKNLFFANTEHGELANDPKLFQGFHELLQKGSTNFLDNEEPFVRGADAEMTLPANEPLPNTSEGLFRAAIGLNTTVNFSSQQVEQPNINVSVTTGHLKYAAHPLMVGHFEGDAILNAEMVLDIYLGNALTVRQRLGIYPGALGSNMVVMNGTKGGVVVGLGSKEALTQHELAKTIKMACLKYLLTLVGTDSKLELKQVGLSTLMIGTGYANLSMNSSLEAIIEGVSTANREILATMGHGYPQITSLEIVELYRDKAEQAYVKLNYLRFMRLFPFRVVGPIQVVDGSRNFFTLNEGQDWWARITALEKADGGRKGFYITANSGSSNVQARNLPVNPSKIGPLLNKAIEQPVWNNRLALAMFGLFVPKDFQQAFRSQQNILWILDKTTAQYPLELMHYDNKLSEPMAVKSGMIRQLSSHYASAENNYSNGFKALVIGDPMLDRSGGVAQLPGAAKEAEIVDSLLVQFGYDSTKLMHASSTEIFMNLFDGYRVLHIAGHGVVKYGSNKETGILVSDGMDNIVITTAEINQIAPVPDLVFINCCYLGKVDKAQERHFREKYQLAANIGTQFIENGAKAVVVAGWPVDDNAALLFAEVFYTGMLAGMGFGEAVLKARRDCYETFGNTNTWGAYQCYGDPFFKLEKGRTNPTNKVKKPYFLPKEAIIDLEAWMVKARTDGKYTNLVDSLHEIAGRIKESGFGNEGSTLEQLAICYAEIGEIDESIKLFGALFKLENAAYSSKSIDMYHELKGLMEMKSEVSLKALGPRNPPAGPNDNKKKQLPFEDLIDRVEAQMNFSDTYARRRLVADTYRRKAMWMNRQGDYLAVIDKMAKAYNHAFNIISSVETHKKFYAIYYWILAELSSCNDRKTHDKKLSTIKGILGASLHQYLLEQEKKYDSLAYKADFDVLITKALLAECKLLCIKEKKGHEDTVGQILGYMKQAMGLVGSPKVKAEQRERLDFILLYMQDSCLPQIEVYKDSLKKLREFYGEAK